MILTLLGIWFGKSKPHSDSIFECLFDEIENLKNICINIVFKQENFNIKVNLYGFIGDSPAKAMFLHMVSHNGYHACPYCIKSGNLTY